MSGNPFMVVRTITICRHFEVCLNHGIRMIDRFGMIEIQLSFCLSYSEKIYSTLIA